MRRAKNHHGNPKPLTVNDAFELIKFQAHAACYPEQEPN